LKASLSEISKPYDHDYFNGERDLSPIRIINTVRLLGNVKDKLILDLGCGTGEGSLLLRNLGARVICVDISKFAASACSDLNFASVLSTTHFLPFHEKTFDGVLFMDVIEHIPRNMVVQTLIEMKRVTKACGKIAIHTMPTLFLEKLSAVYGLINKQHWRRWGMQGGHVNTYTVWKLRKDLMLAGLDVSQFEIGTYPSSGPFSKVIIPCSHLLRPFLGNDLWVACSP
jgi:SAM-dependent methyltransferase